MRNLVKATLLAAPALAAARALYALGKWISVLDLVQRWRRFHDIVLTDS